MRAILHCAWQAVRGPLTVKWRLEQWVIYLRHSLTPPSLPLTGLLALPFAFFHCLETPYFVTSFLPTFPLRPTSRSHLSQKTPSQFRLPLTDPFADPLTPNSSAHRPSPRPSHVTVPLIDPLTNPLIPHSSAHRSAQFFFNAYLGFRAWAPGTLHHENLHNDFQVGCIIEAAGFCGWWPKIVILISKLQISHGRLPLFGARKSGGNLW